MSSVWDLKKSAKFMICQLPYVAKLPNVIYVHQYFLSYDTYLTQHSHAHTHFGEETARDKRTGDHIWQKEHQPHLPKCTCFKFEP